MWQAAGPAALALLLICVFRVEGRFPALWVLLPVLDALVIGFALLTAAVWPVALALVATLAAVGCALLDGGVSMPTGTALLLLGAFSCLFPVAALALANRAARGCPDARAGANSEALAAASVLLPYGLLVAVVQRLAPADPSPVFALALGLAVLAGGVAWYVRRALPVLPALAGSAWVGYAWHLRVFDATDRVVPPAWYLGFALFFSVYPWLAGKRLGGSRAPWVASALAFPVWFVAIWRTLVAGEPAPAPGLIALACAAPACAGLVATLRFTPDFDPLRLTRIALYAGVALGFVTLAVPLQLEKQWVTVAWALEGVALCVLYGRVPHRGLLVTGVALLAGSFVRLGLNPAVLDYHPREVMPLWNWFLYAYGVVAVALLAAAPRVERAALPADFCRGASVLLRAGACWLLFLLLNLEIADFFSAPGERVSLVFSGNFARAMAYSLGWGLFAVGLLLVGIVSRRRGARHAAVILMAGTLGKLFLHDLAYLHQLYRIGAFVGVAILAMGISFLYQKYVPADDAP